MFIRYTEKTNLRCAVLLTLTPVLLGYLVEWLRISVELTDRSTFNIRANFTTLQSIIEKGLFPLLCVLLIGLCFSGHLSFFHTSLLTLGSSTAYAMGISLLSSMDVNQLSPSLSINGWLWRVQSLGENIFLIYFSACLLWGVLNRKYLAALLSALFLTYQKAVIPICISINQYFENVDLPMTELIYDVLPAAAILLMALYIFLSCFLWKEE